MGAGLLLLLAFQIISGHVRARFSSYPGIPTPRCKRGRLHSDFVGFDMHAENLSVYKSSYGVGEEGSREYQF